MNIAGIAGLGMPHAYRNMGNGPARVLVLFTLGNFVRMKE
jgi:hypothetical protein